MAFVFTANKKTETVAAHSFVLQGRQCSLLMQTGPLIGKVDKKAGNVTCTISEQGLTFCNVQIMLMLLRWVYTGETKAIEASDDLVSLVNLLATTKATGLDGTRLEYVAEGRLQQMTTLSNVHLMLAKATELKVERLSNHCKQFAFAHWQEFISDKSGCRRFSVELLAELSAKQQKGDFQAVAERPQPEDPVHQHYAAMASLDPDVAIAPAGGGDPVGCHRAILAGFSDALKQLLVAQSILSPTGAGRRKTANKLPEIALSSEKGTKLLQSSAATQALVNFIYSGSVSFSPLVAVELIHALSDYQFTSLEAACESRIVDGIEVETAFPILGVTFLWVTRPSMGPLRNQCTDFIVQNFSKIDLNSLKGLPPEVFHALQALQRAHAKSGIALHDPRRSEASPSSQQPTSSSPVQQE